MSGLLPIHCNKMQLQSRSAPAKFSREREVVWGVPGTLCARQKSQPMAPKNESVQTCLTLGKVYKSETRPPILDAQHIHNKTPIYQQSGVRRALPIWMSWRPPLQVLYERMLYS